MTTVLNIDDINAELSAVAEAVRAPVLPREVAVHPFEAAKLDAMAFDRAPAQPLGVS